MKRLLLPLLAALALPTAGNAGIDPEVRKACLKAVDFQGCVRAYAEPQSSSETMGGILIPHPLAGKNEIYDGTLWKPNNWTLIHVLAGSSAETSGLLRGDKLLKINGYNPNQFAWPALRGEQYKQGTFNTYKIQRGTEVLKIRTKNDAYFIPYSSKVIY